MNVCILDLASLRFERSADRRRVWVRTAAGELLAAVTVAENADDRRCAAAACDSALATGTVLRHVDGGTDQPVEVVLYNPYSNEVAVGALPLTRAFGDGEPLPLPVEGTVAVLGDDHLDVGGRLLPQLTPGVANCARSLSSHPDPR